MSVSKLSQIVAVEPSIKTEVHKQITELDRLAQHGVLVSGVHRRYRPVADDGEQFPDEQTLVQVRIQDVLERVQTLYTRAWDVVATREYGNTQAKTDVKIGNDDTPLLPNVPVGTLMYLEKQLTDLQTLVGRLPTLDTADRWAYDDDDRVYKTDPVETTRPQKVQTPLVLAPATKEHPAQVQLVSKDVIVGYWSTTKASGAIKAEDRDKYLERIRVLLRAVKYARETANTTDVEDQRLGRVVLGYVFG